MTHMLDTIEPMKANEPGIYHAVRVGVWIDQETGEAVYAADIALPYSLTGPDAVVGAGPTLQAALDAAFSNLKSLGD